VHASFSKKKPGTQVVQTVLESQTEHPSPQAAQLPPSKKNPEAQEVQTEESAEQSRQSEGQAAQFDPSSPNPVEHVVQTLPAEHSAQLAGHSSQAPLFRKYLFGSLVLHAKHFGPPELSQSSQFSPHWKH
jgi:hypothetical protein